MGQTPVIEANGLTIDYRLGKRWVNAIRDVSICIEPLEIHGLVGESGSGKSTLGLILLGFLTPTSGQVLYRGKELRSLARSEWLEFRREVQAVFQDPFSVYNPFYTVDHVLEVPIAKFKLAKSR